ncbi:MAG: HNH endonuclease [Anaerosomatales bacterium]|nr:HNH endonuclease [Anaerosomatales bacterium]
MRGFVANTDYDWFCLLAQRSKMSPLEEVNFWRPSDRDSFKALTPGEPFFFRLKRPYNAIAGFGWFARFTVLPVWLAWDAFREENGADSLGHLVERLTRYRRRMGHDDIGRATDFEIGCIIVTQPVFFPEDLWIQEPADWRKNIVSGRTEDLSSGEGKRVFDECLARAASLTSGPTLPLVGLESVSDRYGEPTLVKPRLGQGAFRVTVLDAYERACAVTHEHSLPVLEAAHIRPYSQGGPHDVRNGLALRSDIHRLFDTGYVTVTPDYRFRVSEALADDYNNGRIYYPLDGQQIHLPSQPSAHPDPELLAWHAETVWRG